MEQSNHCEFELDALGPGGVSNMYPCSLGSAGESAIEHFL